MSWYLNLLNSSQGYFLWNGISFFSAVGVVALRGGRTKILSANYANDYVTGAQNRVIVSRDYLWRLSQRLFHLDRYPYIFIRLRLSNESHKSGLVANEKWS